MILMDKCIKFRWLVCVSSLVYFILQCLNRFKFKCTSKHFQQQEECIACWRINVKIVADYSWSRCAEVRVRLARAAARRVSLVMVEWWECGDWWRLTELVASYLGVLFVSSDN